MVRGRTPLVSVEEEVATASLGLSFPHLPSPSITATQPTSTTDGSNVVMSLQLPPLPVRTLSSQTNRVMDGHTNGDWRLPPYHVTDTNCINLTVDEDDIATSTQSRPSAEGVDNLEKIRSIDLIRKNLPNLTDTKHGALEAMLEKLEAFETSKRNE